MYRLYPWARMCSRLRFLSKYGCDKAKKFKLPMAIFGADANAASDHKNYFRRNQTAHAKKNQG